MSLVLTAADHHDGSPARTPSLGGAGGRGHGLTWPSAARGRRCLQCSRQSFAGAQRASLGAPLRTLEPWAGGGGRPRMRTAGVQGEARHGPRASVRGRRVLPPAPPLSTPRPASRSPPLRRVGSGARRAARNCFHCKQKKATHDQAGGGEARGGRGGGSGRDGKRGPGDPGLRRGPLGRPFGQAGPLGSSATPGDRGDQGRWRVAGPPSPASGHTSGATQLATCRRSAFTPAACLTRLESKNKKNYDASEASEGEERRFHFSPTTTAALPRRVQSSTTVHLLPGPKN